jgi:hypothetical protein
MLIQLLKDVGKFLVFRMYKLPPSSGLKLVE